MTKAEMIKKAIAAQAEDSSLWAVNIPGEEFTVGIGEAYIQQSLRWLHQVVENGDEKALNAILEQSEDHKNLR